MKARSTMGAHPRGAGRKRGGMHRWKVDSSAGAYAGVLLYNTHDRMPPHTSVIPPLTPKTHAIKSAIEFRIDAKSSAMARNTAPDTSRVDPSRRETPRHRLIVRSIGGLSWSAGALGRFAGTMAEPQQPTDAQKRQSDHEGDHHPRKQTIPEPGDQTLVETVGECAGDPGERDR